MSKPTDNKPGRPSGYSETLADHILTKISGGKSLRSICIPVGMPDRGTVIHWLDSQPGFAAKYARAREAQGDAMDDLILDTARSTTSENAAASRVQIDAYKWRAAKLRPKVYGEFSRNEISGPDGGALKVETNLAVIDAQIAALLAEEPGLLKGMP